MYLGRHPAEFGDQQDEIVAKMLAWSETEDPPVSRVQVTGLF
jgi:hypothetical protein